MFALNKLLAISKKWDKAENINKKKIFVMYHLIFSSFRLYFIPTAYIIATTKIEGQNKKIKKKFKRDKRVNWFLQCKRIFLIENEIGMECGVMEIHFFFFL